MHLRHGADRGAYSGYGRGVQGVWGLHPDPDPLGPSAGGELPLRKSSLRRLRVAGTLRV